MIIVQSVQDSLVFRLGSTGLGSEFLRSWFTHIKLHIWQFQLVCEPCQIDGWLRLGERRHSWHTIYVVFVTRIQIRILLWSWWCAVLVCRLRWSAWCTRLLGTPSAIPRFGFSGILCAFLVKVQHWLAQTHSHGLPTGAWLLAQHFFGLDLLLSKHTNWISSRLWHVQCLFWLQRLLCELVQNSLPVIQDPNISVHEMTWLWWLLAELRVLWIASLNRYIHQNIILVWLVRCGKLIEGIRG